jgi:hypothetical protein
MGQDQELSKLIDAIKASDKR